MINTAVILAAGVGSRFGQYTEDRPKGFVELGKMPMIEQSVINLINSGIEEIIIGTGYHEKWYTQLAEKYKQIKCVKNKEFADTNSMYTLYCCKELIKNDFILLESDLIYEIKALKTLINNNKKNILLASQFVKEQDAYYVEVDNEQNLVNCGTNLSELTSVYGEFVGIHKISYSLYQNLINWYADIIKQKPKLGYEYALMEVSRNIEKIYVLREENLIWYEIDDETDLNYAIKNILPKINN